MIVDDGTIEDKKIKDEEESDWVSATTREGGGYLAMPIWRQHI